MQLREFGTIPFISQHIQVAKKISPRRRQVVTALVVEGESILLYRPQVCGEWIPFQGEVGNNQYVVKELRREVHEEVGLEVIKECYLGSILRPLSIDHPKSNSYDEYHYHWYLARTKGNVHCGEGVSEARWFDLSDLAEWDLGDISEYKKGMLFRAIEEAVNTDLINVEYRQGLLSVLKNPLREAA